MTTKPADRAAIIPENIPGQATNDKPLHVHRFTGGYVGITCRGMALHLSPEDAAALTMRLLELHGARP